MRSYLSCCSYSVGCLFLPLLSLSQIVVGAAPAMVALIALMGSPGAKTALICLTDAGKNATNVAPLQLRLKDPTSLIPLKTIPGMTPLTEPKERFSDTSMLIIKSLFTAVVPSTIRKRFGHATNTNLKMTAEERKELNGSISFPRPISAKVSRHGETVTPIVWIKGESHLKAEAVPARFHKHTDIWNQICTILFLPLERLMD